MLIGVVLSSNKTYSQKKFYPITIKLDAGGSVVGNWSNFIDTKSSVLVDKSFATPVGQLAFEYKFIKRFGVAFMGSYQYMNYDLFKISEEGLVNAKIHRINIGIRPTVYYVNNDKISLYSGLRLGMTFWKVKIETDKITDYIESLLPGIVGDFIVPRIPLNDTYSFYKRFFAMQLTLIGIEAYFSDHIGVNFELACGSPYFFIGGVNFRF